MSQNDHTTPPSEESTALQGGCLSSFLDQLWSIAIFRSWRILFFFAIWSTAVCLINHFAYPLALKSTLLTVLGIVLGFVISFRTTTSYDRHNEARKLWSRMVFATRMFARTVWFHVPEDAPGGVDSKDQSLDKRNARILLEKKAVINLLEAYPIAVKHYLRREGNIDYVDLYWFVHFLPRYPFPSNIYDNDREHRRGPRDGGEAEMGLGEQGLRRTPSRMHQRGSTTTSNTLTEASSHNRHPSASDRSLSRSGNHLRPAENPYKKSFIERCIPYPRTRRKDQVDNVPLEISFYLSSYIAALEDRNRAQRNAPYIEPPAMSLLHTSLSDLVNVLTEMERIATTRVIYSKHLWLITIIYCILLPFEILGDLGWMTIPATTLTAFMFFGFLLAGAEIENPFGYDKNDLPLKDFIINIHKELHSMTSRPTPQPSEWVFDPNNDRLFPACLEDESLSPEKWVQRGSEEIGKALHKHVRTCRKYHMPENGR